MTSTINNRQFVENAPNTTFNSAYAPTSRKQYERDIYWVMYKKYLNMAVSRYEYYDLPDSIDPILLEKILVTNGAAGVVKIGDSLMVAPVSLTGFNNLTAMYKPDKFRLAFNPGNNLSESINKTYTVGKDGVIIGNDMNYLPVFSDVITFLQPLTNLYVQRLNNAKKLSSPIVIETDDQNVNLYEQQMIANALNDDDFAVVSRGKGATNPASTTSTIDLSEAFHGPEISAEIANYDAEIKELLSKNNFSRTTESGVSDTEINKQDDGSHSNGLLGYQMRKQGLREMNNLFGTNVSIDWRDSDAVQRDGDHDQPTVEG